MSSPTTSWPVHTWARFTIQFPRPALVLSPPCAEMLTHATRAKTAFIVNDVFINYSRSLVTGTQTTKNILLHRE
jgi:hypothetical protein